VQAAWIGVGSQNNIPANGKWHKWIIEVYVFLRKCFLN
jgi:hypothetical protein